MATIYSDEYKRILTLLKNARKSQFMTQQVLADKLGKPQSFVAKYERGERRLDIVEFIKIADLLEIDIRLVIQTISYSSTK